MTFFAFSAWPLSSGGSEPELWIPEQERHEDRQHPQAGGRHVEDEGLLLAAGELFPGSEALHDVRPLDVVRPEGEERLLGEAADRGGHGQEEGCGAEDGVYGDQPRPEPGRGSLTGEEQVPVL